MVPTDSGKLTKTPPTGRAGGDDARKAGAEPSELSKDGVQGEGNYAAARAFNDAERKFVASGKVDAAARAAAPKSESERQEMFAAEQEGKRRAKGEDPAVAKAPPGIGTPGVPGTGADPKRR